MPAPNNPLINDLTKRDQYLSQLASLQKPQLPAQSYGFQNMVMREPPQNGLVSVQAPPPQAPPAQAQAPQAQKPKASFQPKKAYSRPVDTQRSRIMADEAYQNELKGYESQISQGYPVDPLARRRTAERYRNEIARLDAIDNAAEREDYGNQERARKASNASIIDEMAGQALDESSAAFAKSTPSAPVVKRNPNGTPTTADPYQYGSLSPNRPANLDRGQGPFTPEPPGPSSSPVPPGPPRQSIDSILDGLRQFQGQSTPQPPFVQAVKEAVAKSTTGQLGALAAPPQAPEPNEIEGTVNPAPVAPTAPAPVAAPTPVAARPAPTQADIDTLNNQMKFEELARQPQALDPAFVEQMRNPYTGPQIGAPRPLPQGTPRGFGEQLFESTFGVGGLLGPPMPSDYGAQAPRTQAEADQRGVDQLVAEINTGIQGVLGGIAGSNLNANRKPAPGSGMRPAATVQEGPVLRGRTPNRAEPWGRDNPDFYSQDRSIPVTEINEALRARDARAEFADKTNLDPKANAKVRAEAGKQIPPRENKGVIRITQGAPGEVVDRPNVPYPDPLQLPKPAVVDPAAQALENLTRTNAQNETARRRNVETAPTRKAAADQAFAKQAAKLVAERVGFAEAQDRKEAVRVQAAKDKANLEKNPVNPITGEKQFPTDAEGAPVLTTEQLAKRSGIKGGTPEAGPVSQALADKQANKKALVEAANKGDMAAVDKLLAEGKAIDARARAAEEKSKTVVAKAGAQGASFARDLAGRVALDRQRAGLTFDQTAIPLEGTSTRKPAKAAPAPEPEPQTGIEVLAKPTTAEPLARTQPTAPSEAKDAKRQRPVDLSAPVEQRAKAIKKDPVVVEATPAGAKKVESTSTPTTPIPVVPEAKAPEAEPKQTPVKPTPRGPVKKAIAAITGQDKKPISTPADKPKTVAPKDETADRVARAKRLKVQTDLIEKKPKGKK